MRLSPDRPERPGAAGVSYPLRQAAAGQPVLPAATGWSVPLRPAAAGQPVRPAATGRSVPLRPAAAGQPLWPAPAGPGPLRSGGLSAGGPAVWRRPVLPLAVRPAEIGRAT